MALIACAAAKPGLLSAPLAYSVPAPFITATSHQVIARNYNGIAHAPIVAAAAPVAPVAKVVAAPVAVPAPLAVAPHVAPVAARFVSPYASLPVGYSAPVNYAAAPFAYSSPFAAKYVASPYAGLPAPLHYSTVF